MPREKMQKWIVGYSSVFCCGQRRFIRHILQRDSRSTFKGSDLKIKKAVIRYAAIVEKSHKAEIVPPTISASIRGRKKDETNRNPRLPTLP